jgi:hypothetical protein
MNSMNFFEEAVRTAVCTECLSPAGIGPCGHGQWKECPLNRFLPQAIDAVNAGRNSSLLEYFREFLESMRGEESERHEGTRMPPEDAEWFDRFLPLIAAAVEEVKSRKLARINPSTRH